MINLTEIEFEGEFANSIKEYFIKNKPRKIIETGSFHGNGSTRIIASLIKSIPLDGVKLHSIECKCENINIARLNLMKIQLNDAVIFLNGLSIPDRLLPSVQQINEIIKEARQNPSIKIDHEQDIDNASKYYQMETSPFKGSGVLELLLRGWNGNADFVLLDSAGHLGFIEFNHLISKLKSSCAIALDDVNHIKHYKSKDVIKNDKRFEIISESKEKFGSLIAKFNPV